MKRLAFDVLQGDTLVGFATLPGVLRVVPHPRSNIVMRIRRNAFVEPAFYVPGGYEGKETPVWRLADVDEWVQNNPYRASGRK